MRKVLGMAAAVVAFEGAPRSAEACSCGTGSGVEERPHRGPQLVLELRPGDGCPGQILTI
jgi:hypothetical protein